VDIAEDHVAQINQHGLEIKGPVAQFIQRLPALTPEQLTGQYPLIFLAVKAQHTEQAAKVLAPHLRSDGLVVSLQNGLNERVIAQTVGEQRTVAGFINFAADYLEPGVLDFGNRGAIKIGELTGEITPRVCHVVEILKDFEPESTAVTNIAAYKWGKLAYGCLLFATALANETMTESLSDPAHQDFFIALAREVLLVAQRENITPLGFDGFEPEVFITATHKPAAILSLMRMAEHYRFSTKQRSGVWRDLAVRKRKTEVDTQIAGIVHIAHRHRQPAPFTQAVIQMIQEVEQGIRKIDRKNLSELSEGMNRQ